MKINHLGIVVEDIASALAFWRDALGLPLDKTERNEAEEIDIAFLPLGSGEIELIAPYNETSGVAKYLAKRGPGLHHVCLEVEDIEAIVARLQAHGVHMINESPKINADGVKYCFVHPKSALGVLVELYELPEKRATQE
ncbi:MAG: methylmalonyl-CoA epimerase [Anaerolineae bacterium]